MRSARTAGLPAAWFASRMMRACSRRASAAQAADSGHSVSCPLSASKPTAATCPARPGAIAAHRSRSVPPRTGKSQARSVTGG